MGHLRCPSIPQSRALYLHSYRVTGQLCFFGFSLWAKWLFKNTSAAFVTWFKCVHCSYFNWFHVWNEGQKWKRGSFSGEQSRHSDGLSYFFFNLLFFSSRQGRGSNYLLRQAHATVYQLGLFSSRSSKCGWRRLQCARVETLCVLLTFPAQQPGDGLPTGLSAELP